MKSLGNMLKVELAPAVDAPDLSAREKTARKQQLQRYMGDYKTGADGYEEVSYLYPDCLGAFPEQLLLNRLLLTAGHEISASCGAEAPESAQGSGG